MTAEPPHVWVLSHVLLVPMTEATTALPDEPGRWQEVSGTIGLPVVEHHGLQSVPVFTSEAEFARWDATEDARFVALPASGLLKAFLGTPADRLIVDNAGSRAFVIDRDEAKALLAIAASVPDDAPAMQLRPPQPEAAALIDVLRGACSRYPEIREAYLYRAYQTTYGGSMDVPDDAWKLTLLYAFDENTSEERIGEVARAVGVSLREAVAAHPGLMPSPVELQVTRGDSEWVRTVSRTGAPIVVPVAREHLTDTPIVEGKPSREPPPGLLDAVRRISEADDAVIEVTYHQVALLDRDGQPQLAIGVRLRDGTDEQRAQAAVRALGATLTPNRWGYDTIYMLTEHIDAPHDHRTTIFRRGDPKPQDQ